MTPNSASVARLARALAACTLVLGFSACKNAEHARAASLMAAESAEQARLSAQLSAQKDSLMTVVLDADQFIAQVDSSISRVKNLPSRDRSKVQAEGVLQDQLQARQDMLFKVDALVKRAQQTAAQLAESKRREAGLRKENAELRDSLSRDQQMIAQLAGTIDRQVTQISELQTSVAQLTEANTKLNEELRVSLASNARVYYVIGRESDLEKQGIIVKEGGMRMLVGRIGERAQPARKLDPALFTAIDARDVSRIAMPDSTKKYRIVSRHSLDDAEVRERDKQSFRGGELRITDANRFWSPSRYLILVQG